MISSWRFSLLLLFGFVVSLGPAMAEPNYSTPETTLKTYFAACEAGDFAAADACYTKSSRDFLQEHPEVMAGRQPEHLKASYERLSLLTFTTEMVNSKRAILTPNDTKVPPFFLRQQAPKEGWRIDWHFMSNYMRADQNGWSWVNPRVEKIWKSRQ